MLDKHQRILSKILANCALREYNVIVKRLNVFSRAYTRARYRELI